MRHLKLVSPGEERNQDEQKDIIWTDKFKLRMIKKNMDGRNSYKCDLSCMENKVAKFIYNYKHHPSSLYFTSSSNRK